MMEATARQTVLHNTIHKRKKQPPLSAHDRRKPLYQAVYALLPTGNSARTAYLHCIKDGMNIDPCCGSGGMFVQSLKFVDRHNGYKRKKKEGVSTADKGRNGRKDRPNTSKKRFKIRKEHSG